MSRFAKVTAGLAGALALLLVVALLVVQSKWFQDSLRQKVIAAVEESTGGHVEVGAFRFDVWHLRAQITNFTLHGSEPSSEAPLVQIALLELRVKLFAGLKHGVDLSYLGINHPQVNLIVNPDGTTNIPGPKVKQQPSQTSGLATVVDLAISQFRIDNGSLRLSQKTSQFSAEGKDLSVLLSFNSFNSTYTGRISINPLVLAAVSGAPVKVQVNLPVLLEKDAISISGGRLTSPQSQVAINAGLRNLNSPKITARVNATLSLSELGFASSSQHLTADFGGAYDDRTGEIDVQTAHTVLGQSSLDASGGMAAHGNQSLQFHGKLELDELSRLSKTGNTIPLGWLQLNGHVKMQTASSYAVDAALSALGGSAAVKVEVENFRKVNAQAYVSNLKITQMGYSGVLGGAIDAQADLKEKGSSGLAAQAHLIVSPGTHGIPITGQVNGQFVGAHNTLRLEKSFLALPNSRLELSGDINQQLNASLISHSLADFSPLTGSLPIKLQGGIVRLDAQVKGDISAPKINAHAAIDRFALQGNSFTQLAADLAVSPAALTVSNGTLSGSGLNSTFDAALGLRKWKPFAKSALVANVIANGQLAHRGTSVSGSVKAEAHVTGTYGDPVGMANLELVNGALYGQLFQKVQGHLELEHELITLSNFEMDAAGGRLLAQGNFRHPDDSLETGRIEFHVNSTDIQLANVQPLAKRSPGIAGAVKLNADGSGDLRSGANFQPANVSANFSALGLKISNQAAGDLTAQAQTSNGSVNYNLHSNFAGSAIQIDGSTLLTQEYVTRATASIANLPLERALSMAGQGALPLKGLVSLNGNVSGTVAHPDASFNLVVSNALAYSQPLNELSAHIRYTPTLMDISNVNLEAPAGTLKAAAHFAHKDGDFSDGQMQFHASSGQIDLAKISQSPLSGGIQFNTDIAGDLKEDKLLLSNAAAKFDATSLRANGRDLGELHASATTQQHTVRFQLNSNLGQSDLKASGQTELSGNYATQAKLLFSKVSWANIAPEKPNFDVHLDGEANVAGPMRDWDALTGNLKLNQFAFDAGSRSRPVHLETDAPVLMSLAHSVIKVQHLKIQDAKSYLEVAGALNLKNADNGLGLDLKGNADLSLLQNADRDFYSSGNALVDARLHGSLAKPLVNGRLELKNANVNYVNASNGLSNGNGVILLNGTNATIQKLTGESGGGKIAITGFAGLTGTDAAFNFHATASKVRTRYQDAGITENADISLAGNTHRSTLNGTITLQRISYSSTSDVGSFLSTASAPPFTPSAPSPLLSGMRLDLRIVTAADMRVISSYSDKLSLTSNLTITGTAQDPGVVGRVTVTNGELVFFGNTYAVNTGTINFYNVNAIEPILDLSLETITQGVDVTLGVRGPIHNLKLSYRSDPPLSFQQIVQLLATNTTPSDPTIAAHQPTPTQQSAGQMGESAVLGQAVANPLASRVQRVFGLSQFKIDPSLSGTNGQPSARVTLQQKITSNLTFTYITDVTQTNSEIVRVTLDITPKISAVALRDYNGNVSVELFYKFQKR